MDVAPDDSRERFSRWAERYDASVRECERRGEFPFAGYSRVLSRVTDLACAAQSTSVLELGCGTGNLSRDLAARGASVVGADWADALTCATANRGSVRGASDADSPPPVL